ncbi:hypothetical protein SAMN04488134_10134 [Amphibacillus marinus]|uniref:Sporulation and spore germination n=1 Tax=Amphibacillus marinus TaxID=872970 RepID=A0A1H8GDI0_9BACI|nr:hypothetical protein [Amphibacillus marinus]SEN41805.1 hypothetical protein SAMN04488134_10134 [Amphibacillus marinus]
MDRNEKEDQLIEQLKKMPQIKDDLSKEMLLKRININLNKQDQKQDRLWYKWFLPSVASIAMVFILIIVAQQNLFQGDDQIMERTTSDRDMSLRSDSNNDEVQMFLADEEESGSATADEADNYQNENDGDDLNILDSARMALPTEEDQLVYYDHDSFVDADGVETFTVTVVDVNANFVIPLTLISSSSTGDPNDYYSRINSFLSDEAIEELGISLYPFQDMSFEFGFDGNVVYLTVPDDYQFSEGTFAEGLLDEVLSIMFADYDVDTVILQTESGQQGIEMSHSGLVTEIELLDQLANSAYKIYQASSERLLVPITRSSDEGSTFNTIDEAFAEMQVDQSDSYLTASIPAEVVDITVEQTSNEQLTVKMGPYPDFGDNILTSEMIEAILMTAKSFGFQEVAFEIDGINGEVGRFNLNEAVPVPDGINAKLIAD